MLYTIDYQNGRESVRCKKLTDVIGKMSKRVRPFNDCTIIINGRTLCFLTLIGASEL